MHKQRIHSGASPIITCSLTTSQMVPHLSYPCHRNNQEFNVFQNAIDQQSRRKTYIAPEGPPIHHLTQACGMPAGLLLLTRPLPQIQTVVLWHTMHTIPRLRPLPQIQTVVLWHTTHTTPRLRPLPT